MTRPMDPHAIDALHIELVGENQRLTAENESLRASLRSLEAAHLELQREFLRPGVMADLAAAGDGDYLAELRRLRIVEQAITADVVAARRAS